ncbi:nitronate monooxygenase [Mycobacterium sp. 050134]|uniref:nitronate monooxygenase n=1 Tax=Mycobacterium sp. 050134 TaxID=3096111 RepID=UPI002ED88835
MPAVSAPMAGGPSTPALAAEFSNHGGLGFLAGGLIPAELLAEKIAEARALTAGPMGVNLFVPHDVPADPGEVDTYARRLSAEVGRYATPLGTPRHDDFGWRAKLDLVHDLRPEAVSFTFGLPSEDVCRRLRQDGILILGTVTSVDEASQAVSRGVDALVVQGPDAGGHRATFAPDTLPDSVGLDDLLAGVLDAVGCDVVAAGGLANAADVLRVFQKGAAAAQFGTALLLADEAGTSPVHRAALGDPQFTETVLTRAFTGRYARSLRNRFVRDHEDHAVFGFPEIAHLTLPILAAADTLGDPDGTSLWAGTQYRHARSAPVKTILSELMP